MDILAKALEDQEYSLRTQISLSHSLRKLIDMKRKIYGESLAEYLRRAALLRLALENEEEMELKYLAESFVGGVPKSKSGFAKIRDITLRQRKERQKEDEHRA